MSTPNSEYWKQRFTQLEAAQNALGKEAVAQIEKIYRDTQKQIEGQIAAWYERLAKNNDISISEARRWLKGKELKEFQWDVGEYIKYGQENAMNQMWLKELENASAKFHISRLEALNISIEESLQELYLKEEKIVYNTLDDVYKEGYYRTMFELQRGFSIGFDVAKVNNRYVEKVLAKPWAPDQYNFSERIWKSKDQIINEAHKAISQNLLTGADPRKAIDIISKKLDTSKYNAGRLVMTEEAYFSSLAQGDCYKELGCERYRILATLDDRTSEICQSLDGKVYDMKVYQAGTTAPPFHVFCRSTTVPYFDDFRENAQRAARDGDGKTYYVPADMRYSEWKAAFVDKTEEKPQARPQKTVDKSGKSGIIKTGSEKYNNLVQLFNYWGVENRPVSKLKKPLASEEIVGKIGGGDLTKGSCSSLAFAYVGNRNGLDVTDYRGGDSRRLFARNDNIKAIMKLSGVSGQVIPVRKVAPEAAMILQKIETGKEYYFAAGKHAAIVRNTEKGLEYLELQTQAENGWQSFDKYGNIKKTLNKRFGCVMGVRKRYGTELTSEVILASTDDFKDSKEFESILGYLNTAADQQKKGAKGFAR